MTPRALLGLLFHADKAIDLVTTAHRIGLLAQLDAAPQGTSLATLVEVLGARPLRLYKFLDGLESLGLVRRHQSADAIESAEYVAIEPLVPLYLRVLGETSIERDRDRYPWREVFGRLDEVLAGSRDTSFTWPPVSSEAIASFEASMALGTPPIVEALGAARDLFANIRRWLDIGGGDGTVAAQLLASHAELSADVFNLPPVAPLVYDRARKAKLVGRLGFVAGDFFEGEFPHGYQLISFIRVLHDWPAEVARTLLEKAARALPVGGRLVICEELRDADRLAVQFFWTYFLIGADTCQSRLREVTWYVAVLEELGFVDIRVIPGPFDLVVAMRGSRVL